MVEFFTEEPLAQARTFTRAYGGDVLNALVTAARLGSPTGFITRVGNDPFGPGLLAAWQAEGINTQLAPLVEGENGVYFISLLPDGEREFTYRRRGSAASQIRPEDLEPAYLAQARVLLLSGITQALSPSAQAATLAAARMVRAAGGQVAFDPNYRPRLWAERGGLEAAQAAFAELAPYVDFLLPSFPADLPALSLEASTPSKALSALLPHFSLVALKAGSEGTWLAASGQGHFLPAYPPEAVRDTTGAGDAWNGAFLHHWLQGESTLQAGKKANRTAAQKLAYRGAIPPRPWPLDPKEVQSCD